MKQNTHLMAFFQNNLEKLASKVKPFWITMKQNMAVASTRPHANYLLHTPDR